MRAGDGGSTIGQEGEREREGGVTAVRVSSDAERKKGGGDVTGPGDERR